MQRLWEKEKVNSTQAANKGAHGNDGIDRQIECTVWIHLLGFARYDLDNALAHRDDPAPVNGNMDRSDNQHGNAAPDMQFCPRMALKKDDDAVEGITPALISANGKDQKIDTGEKGDQPADEEGGSNQPIIPCGG